MTISGVTNMLVGATQVVRAYAGTTEVWSPTPPPTPGYIYYESTDNNIVVPNVLSGFGANIVSNEYTGGGVWKITFDGPVTTIPLYAFSGKTTLCDITFPDTLETIEQQSFSGCTALASVTIPDNVTTLGTSLFRDCTSLESVYIGSGITNVAGYAFMDCHALSSVTIAGNITQIGEAAFYTCTTLASINLPASLTTIGAYAFRRCAALTTINYSGTKSQWNAITKPSNWDDASPLYLVKCSDDVIILQKDVPANELWYSTTDGATTTGQGLSPTSNSYSGIGKMTFSSDLTAIPDSAFSGNSKVVAVFVSSAVTTIGSRAFADCRNLLCVSFAQKSASVTVKTRTFEASQKLLAIKMPKNISFYNGSVEYVFNTDTSLRYLDVPENLPQLIIGLFNRCYSLTKLHLPSTISNTIGTNSLRFDYSLMNLSFDGTTSTWNAKTKNSNWNTFVPATGITCTNGVATIDDSFTITGRTLNTNKSMIAITTAVSDVVDGYDSSVFMAVTGASNASVLFLSDNSVITSVGNRTFYQSSLLTELRLPPSLTTISQGFCDSCPNLYRLVYCGTMAQWKALWQNSIGSETAVVTNCHSLKEVECKDGVLEVISI